MSHVIAVVNQKGGVGKTATVANVAWELVAQGHSCLAVDLDPQGSLTISLGFDPDALAGQTIYEGMVLPPDHPQHRRVQPLPVELTGLSLIPANLDRSQHVGTRKCTGAIASRRGHPTIIVRERHRIISAITR